MPLYFMTVARYKTLRMCTFFTHKDHTFHCQEILFIRTNKMKSVHIHLDTLFFSCNGLYLILASHNDSSNVIWVLFSFSCSFCHMTKFCSVFMFCVCVLTIDFRFCWRLCYHFVISKISFFIYVSFCAVHASSHRRQHDKALSPHNLKQFSK